VLDLKRDYKPM